MTLKRLGTTGLDYSSNMKEIVKFRMLFKSKYTPKLYFNSLCQQSICYRGPMFWNKVPNSLKKKQSKFGVFLQKPSQICVQIHRVIDYFFINV